MLKKVFIKNYADVNNTDVRNKYGIVAGFFGIFTNAFLGVIKLIIGVLSNSITIMVDAVNNISDMIASVLTLMGFKFSSRKPSEEHPYGYARYEYVADLFVSIFVLVVGVLFAKDAITKIIYPKPIIINISTFAVLFLAVIIKLLQIYVYLDFAESINSNTLISTATDSKNDVITSIAIILSMLIMYLFKINIDGIAALIVSIYIIFNAFKMLKKSLDPLIGIKPTKEQVKLISDKLNSYDDVKGIHDLVIHNYGVNNDFVTVHIEMDETLSFLKAHQVADIIEEDFYNDLDINITVHIDPIDYDDPEVNELKKKISKYLKRLNKDITIHDFRIIKNKKTTKILFDCVTPFELDYEEKDITDYLKDKMNKQDFKYVFIIKIDKNYC
jgi:cation diffusion facilitator family transporter